MNSSPLHIRTATLADMPAIHALVVELAIYEKEPDAVTATVRDYERDFAAGVFQSEVAEMAGEIVGMTLFYTAYSTWKGKMIYLDDFVVRENLRGQGIGKALMESFLTTAEKQNARLVKWQVLNWNEPAIRFYRSISAEIEVEWLNCKIFLPPK